MIARTGDGARCGEARALFVEALDSVHSAARVLRLPGMYGPRPPCPSVRHQLAGADDGTFPASTLINTGIFLGLPWHPVARLFRAPVLGRMAARSGRFLFRTVPRYFEEGRVATDLIEERRRECDRAARRALLRN